MNHKTIKKTELIKNFKNIFLSFLIIFSFVRFQYSQSYALQPLLKPENNLEKIREEQKKLYKFIKEFRSEAIRKGIKPQFYDEHMREIYYDERIYNLNNKQSEFTTPVWKYLEKAVSPYRIKKGKEKLAEHEVTFYNVEFEFRVNRNIIAAIWGIETSFGSITGDFDVINSLANFAYDGRRTKFGREQLIAALTILQKNYIKKEMLKGSWAGAMGQTQFIPTTFLEYAIDHDYDGRRDLWNNMGDIFASTANYLSRHKYNFNKSWGIEVVLPANFDYNLTGLDTKLSVKRWFDSGVKLSSQSNSWPRIDFNDTASIILPAGSNGPVIMVFDNFKTILRYNNSTSYALAVGLLANKIAGFESEFAKAWPKNDRLLTFDERKKLQSFLISKGYLDGKIDGIIGKNSKKALKKYQNDNGYIPDGYASYALLKNIGVITD